MPRTGSSWADSVCAGAEARPAGVIDASIRPGSISRSSRRSSGSGALRAVRAAGTVGRGGTRSGRGRRPGGPQQRQPERSRGGGGQHGPPGRTGRPGSALVTRFHAVDARHDRSRCPCPFPRDRFSRPDPGQVGVPTRPRRVASAEASARVGVPSLASTAETWWSTVLGRDDQPGGDLGVGAAGADQVEHLALATGQPERVRPGRRAAARPGSSGSRAGASSGGRPGRWRPRRARSSSASASRSSAAVGRVEQGQRRVVRAVRGPASAGRARQSPSSCEPVAARRPRPPAPGREPVRRSQTAASPRSHSVAAPADVRRPARPRAGPRPVCRPASTPRPGSAGRGTIHCGSPVPSAARHRLVEARPRRRPRRAAPAPGRARSAGRSG